MPCQNHPEVLDGLAVCWRCRREFCVANCVIELQDYPFCAECKTAQVRDILAGTDMSSLDYAGMDSRFGAWMIDGLIKFGISFGVGQIGNLVAFGVFNTTNFATSAWAGVVVLLFVVMGHLAGMCYEGFMLSRNNGQTLGKMAVNIRVVTAEGNPISARQAWRRAVIKFLFFCFGCETCMGIMLDGVFALGQERASLHDLGAKTRVVNTN